MEGNAARWERRQFLCLVKPAGRAGAHLAQRRAPLIKTQKQSCHAFAERIIAHGLERENVMRPRPAAAEAIICAFQSISAATAKSDADRLLAEIWVQASIASGCNPHMRQEPLSSGAAAGEWVFVYAKTASKHLLYPGRLPDDLFDEVFFILVRLGRVIHDKALKAWHGNVWPDDSSPRALGFRMRLTREALAMDRRRFYGACGFNAKAADALEAGHGSFASPDREMLTELCAYHRIPEEWVMLGNAQDIEA